MKTALRSLLCALIITTISINKVMAAAVIFDFDDPKRLHGVSISLSSDLESFMGFAIGNGISGLITFDPENIENTTGDIIVDAKSIEFQHDLMTLHSLDGDWLDVKNHPNISFRLNSLTDINYYQQNNNNNNDKRFSATANVNFSLKGITNEISVPVRISYRPSAHNKRLMGEKQLDGDLLIVSGAFNIKRADYNIMPDKDEDKINPTVEIQLALVGTHPKTSQNQSQK